MKQTISLVLGILTITISAFCSQGNVDSAKQMRRDIFCKRTYADKIQIKREHRDTRQKEPREQRQAPKRFTQQEIWCLRHEVVPLLQRKTTPEQLQSNSQPKHAKRRKKKTSSRRLRKKLQQTRYDLEKERHWRRELEQRLIRHQRTCNQYAQRSDAILEEYQILWKALHNEQTLSQKQEGHIQHLTQLILELDKRLYAIQREAQGMEFAFSSKCLGFRLCLKAEQEKVRPLKERMRSLTQQLHSSEVRTYHTERMHQYQATHALAFAQTLSELYHCHARKRHLHAHKQRFESVLEALQEQEREWLLAGPESPQLTAPPSPSVMNDQGWREWLTNRLGLLG